MHRDAATGHCAAQYTAEWWEAEAERLRVHVTKLREVLMEHDRKLQEVWGKEESPHAVALGWVRISWDAALVETDPTKQEAILT